MNLELEVARLRAENAELRQQLTLALKAVEHVGALEQRVKELEAQLLQDSHNSNWPSSRDKGRKAKRTRSLRQKSEKKVGGQPGHAGETLKMVAKPDQIQVHRAERGVHCQHALEPEAEVARVERRQVIDLPPMCLEVTEHQVHHLVCPGCGQMSGGQFPAQVAPGVQYGSRLQGLTVYLSQHHLLPMERLCQLLEDLLGASVSAGAVARWIQVAGARTRPLVETIKGKLQQSDVVHCDETGLYVAGQRHWLHVTATPQETQSPQPG